MTEELEKLANLVKTYLQNMTPILSSNMLLEIDKAELVKVDDHTITFAIKAPFYNMKTWKKSGVIVHTGESYNGVKHYANWVNESGGFAKHNKSEHWVNRALNEAALMMPNAIIINELEL